MGKQKLVCPWGSRIIMGFFGTLTDSLVFVIFIKNSFYIMEAGTFSGNSGLCKRMDLGAESLRNFLQSIMKSTQGFRLALSFSANGVRLSIQFIYFIFGGLA